MRFRRGKWFTRISQAIGTVLVGVLIGVLIPTVAADLAPQEEVAQERVAESPVARQFIDAFVNDDRAILNALQVDAATVSHAARFKAEYAKIDRPVHLGSWIVGSGLTLHAYSAHAVGMDGADDQLAWRVLTAAGTVGVIDPPGQVATP